jgi:hypothetical protein
MSDVDSLDGLTNDIDIDNMHPTGEQKVIDLDDLLDEVAESFLTTDSEFQETDDIFGDSLNSHLQSEKKRNIDTSLYGVPIHLRKKWSEILLADVTVPESTQLRPSHAYLSWDNESYCPTFEKLIRETIVKSCSKCDLKTPLITAIEHALIDNQEVRRQYVELLISRQQNKIQRDPNYTPEKYPHLGAILASK